MSNLLEKQDDSKFRPHSQMSMGEEACVSLSEQEVLFMTDP